MLYHPLGQTGLYVSELTLEDVIRAGKVRYLGNRAGRRVPA